MKLADRFCNLRDFAALCGKGSAKVRSYFWEAQCLFDSIERLPAEIRGAVQRTLEYLKNLAFDLSENRQTP